MLPGFQLFLWVNYDVPHVGQELFTMSRIHDFTPEFMISPNHVYIHNKIRKPRHLTIQWNVIHLSDQYSIQCMQYHDTAINTKTIWINGDI